MDLFKVSKILREIRDSILHDEEWDELPMTEQQGVSKILNLIEEASCILDDIVLSRPTNSDVQLQG